MTVVDGLRAHRTERRAASVTNDCIGRVQAAMSGQSCAVREIDVFVDHEEVFVESSKLVEDVPSDQEASAARAKDFA